MEYITSGIPFKWWYILFDYANELYDNFDVVASYRKSEGQYGETDGIKWHACLSCMKWLRFYIFKRMHFIITYISLEGITNNFLFEQTIEKRVTILKRTTNSFQNINVILFYCNHRHVSATYVAVFRAARERIRPLATPKVVTWVVETCRWCLYCL